MKFRMLKWVLAGMCGLLAACAIINVNVYFPEKAVKEAYKSLDDMLLKNEGDKASTPEKKPEAEPAFKRAGSSGRPAATTTPPLAGKVWWAGT